MAQEHNADLTAIDKIRASKTGDTIQAGETKRQAAKLVPESSTRRGQAHTSKGKRIGGGGKRK